MKQAKQEGLSISFDVNYRQLLWEPTDARDCLLELLPFVDLLIGTQPDLGLLAGATFEDPTATLVALHDRFRTEAVVMTLPDGGALAYDGNRTYSAAGHPVAIVNRLGAGDAFAAGLLYGCLTAGLAAGLAWGSAMAALKLTIPANVPLVRKCDVERLVRGGSPELVR
jgi:2-dehydro-3-deoxygluconokinase